MCWTSWECEYVCVCVQGVLYVWWLLTSEAKDCWDWLIFLAECFLQGVCLQGENLNLWIYWLKSVIFSGCPDALVDLFLKVTGWQNLHVLLLEAKKVTIPQVMLDHPTLPAVRNPAPKSLIHKWGVPTYGFVCNSYLYAFISCNQSRVFFFPSVDGGFLMTDGDGFRLKFWVKQNCSSVGCDYCVQR
jgi:hypothetical protein